MDALIDPSAVVCAVPKLITSVARNVDNRQPLHDRTPAGPVPQHSSEARTPHFTALLCMPFALFCKIHCIDGSQSGERHARYLQTMSALVHLVTSLETI